MRDDKNDKREKKDYNRFLNRNDPLDHLILKLAEKGKLKVEVVKIDDNSKSRCFSDSYSRKSLPHRGKHSS
jgi:hypothetical protein